MTNYAFPTVNEESRSKHSFDSENHYGMTLKDWFAGQIMAAMLSSDASSATQRDQNGQLCGFDKTRLAHLAKNAYQVAEAMLQARTTEKAAR